MVETILSVSTETSIAQLDCYSCPSVRLSPSPASAPISAKPARPHQEIFLAIRKVLETNSFFYPCTISNIRTYLDSYERLFTLRGLFPSPVEEIC